MSNAAACVFGIPELRHCVMIALRGLIFRDVRSRLDRLLVNRLSMSADTCLLSDDGRSCVKLVFRRDTYGKEEKAYLLEYFYSCSSEAAGSHWTVLSSFKNYNHKNWIYHLDTEANVWHLV